MFIVLQIALWYFCVSGSPKGWLTSVVGSSRQLPLGRQAAFLSFRNVVCSGDYFSRPKNESREHLGFIISEKRALQLAKYQVRPNLLQLPLYIQLCFNPSQLPYSTVGDNKSPRPGGQLAQCTNTRKGERHYFWRRRFFLLKCSLRRLRGTFPEEENHCFSERTTRVTGNLLFYSRL